MMLKSLLALCVFATLAMAYDCETCYGDMCCNIPSDNQYYLTDFCGGAGTMACGRQCNYAKYYTADRQRFGCGKTLHVCGRGKCLSASVQDAGPNKFVENDAQKAVLDSSVPTCQFFTGSSSCGWSDRILVTATVSGSAPADNIYGPYKVTHEQYKAVVGNATYALEVKQGHIDPSKPLPWDDSWRETKPQF